MSDKNYQGFVGVFVVTVAGKNFFSVVVAGSWSRLALICFDPKKILEQADLLYFAKNPESYLVLDEGGD